MKKVCLALGILLMGLNASAYEFTSGKVFLRGVVGPVINVVRYDAIVSETTPGGGFELGLEAEYVVSKPWSIIGGMRPTFSTGFVNIGFGLGAKYRWDDLGVPVILYTALEITPSVLVPLSNRNTHFNIGLKPSIGADYFVMRDLVLGLQLGINPSFIVTPALHSVEASLDFLFGVMYSI